jgi:hypothetical protein
MSCRDVEEQLPAVKNNDSKSDFDGSEYDGKRFVSRRQQQPPSNAPPDPS